MLCEGNVVALMFLFGSDKNEIANMVNKKRIKMKFYEAKIMVLCVRRNIFKYIYIFLFFF